jgi:hypothetical protein
MYDRQHGLQANLFLAPGEGDGVEEEPSEPAAPAVSGAGRLGLVDP